MRILARVSFGLLVALGLAGAIVGCGRAGSRETTAVSIAANPAPVTSQAQIKLPLASYILTPEEAATLQNAVIIKANQCLARFRIASTMRPDNVRMASDATALDERYSTTVSVEATRRYAYKPDPRYVQTYDDGEKDPNEAPPDPRQREVFEGTTESGQKSHLKDKHGNPVPAGGCYREANVKVQGQSKDYWQTLIRLSSGGMDDAFDRLFADSRLLATDKKWASCMKTKGYSFAHKLDAADSVAEKPQKQQIKVAVDDATCAQQSNYFGVMYALDVAYQNQYISQHQTELATAWSEVHQSLARARQIIAKGR